VAKSYEGITQALQGGQQLTRKELLTALERAGVHLEGLRASNLLNRAALDGLICLGTMNGKQPTFVLLDEWLPQTKSYAGDEALAHLALRYFTSHGPTTLQDFVWWTGLAMVDARSGLEAVKAQLVEEKAEGRSYWRAPTPSPLPDNLPSAYLLPGFDEFVLGYSDRSAIMSAEQGKLIAGVNGVFAYTMILDGQVVGTWKRTFRKGAIEISFLPFEPLPDFASQAFDAAALRYGEFLGMAVKVE
jgi:hypothetical protein